MKNLKRKPLEVLISEVETQDLSRARLAVKEAVDKAQGSWLPTHAIAGALALELQACTSEDSVDAVTEFLRYLADSIENDSFQATHYH